MNVSTVMNFQRGNNFLCNLSLSIFFFASLYGQRGNSTASNLNRLRETKNYLYLVVNTILVYRLSLLFIVLTFTTFECVR